MTPPPPRERVNLRRLPRAAQMAIALVVVVGVSLVAWWTGRDQPPPSWVTERLIPALGWVWLVLVLVALATYPWWRRRRPGGRRG